MRLDGKPIGRIRFAGTRPDDPNDIFPHEHRRELRGLSVFAAWLNHDDSRSVNTMDTLVREGSRSIVRHHLIDILEVQQTATVAEFRTLLGEGGEDVAKALRLVGFTGDGEIGLEHPREENRVVRASRDRVASAPGQACGHTCRPRSRCRTP